ncbi:zinc finger BED domain-containing protein 4-like [Helicoverpa zea]|uniref:zinc finger BED domain-containing protein 4-like n=1 Tax=Helicoverpa zea TaxID=7113 RepID=UPI001F5863A0|nr:zinc finger BED domain-containing protein 4-like [Helicoverpa zea]
MAPPQSEIWKYFKKISNEQASCKTCFKIIKTSGNTSNMKKHVKQHSNSSLDEVSSPKPRLLQQQLKRHCTTTADSATAATSSTSTDNSLPSTSSTVDSICNTISSEQFDKDTAENIKIASQVTPSQKQKQMSITETLNRKMLYSEGGSRHSLLCKLLLYFICVDKRPFDIVKGRGFRRLIKQLCPTFKIPSVDTLKSRLDDLYDVMVLKTRQDIENVGYISLTCDIWTETMTMTSYLGVTAHYYHQNELKAKVLATVELDERHTAIYIAHNLDNICDSFNITKEKITSVVTDNAANMIAAINMFLDRSKHLPCFAHTINLIFESIMKIEEFVSLCNKIRKVVKFFRDSVIQSDILRSKQGDNPLKLILDVSTWWNSVYFMIERYVKLAPIIHPILVMNPKAPPTPSANDLENLNKILKILKPIEYVTREMSGENYVTASKIIPIINCLKSQISSAEVEIEEEECEVINKVKDTILNQIKQRFGHVEDNYIIAVSCILDPRFKTLHFTDPKACAKALSVIRRNMKDYITSSGEESDVAESNDSNLPPEYDFWRLHKNLAHGKNKKKSKWDAAGAEKDELSLYLANPVGPLTVNPHIQWEDMKTIFPLLYKQAQQYLHSPATSVPSERLFSKAGVTLSRARNRLKGKRVNKLLFLGDCTEEEWNI